MSEPAVTVAASADSAPEGIEPAPRSPAGILRHLGPGLITAGAIVGSGELVATTKTGAEAGFWLLWLIIVGCVIKVFAQVELGRYAMSSGKAALAALDDMPGPRAAVNWMLWYWLIMFTVSLGQLGGIIGGVGQAMAICMPITGDYNRSLEEKTLVTSQQPKAAAGLAVPLADADRRTRDDLYWATIITVLTAAVLATGRYGLIQNVSILLVAGFTFVSMVNLFMLQSQPQWAITAAELGQGLSFRLPPLVGELAQSPIVTALAAFGIIGVGTNELIAYPYWCLEKGYARAAGPRDDSPEWAERARGWIRVVLWDASICMVVYTFATLVFYLLGAAVLHREGLNPGDSQMIVVLSRIYVPVFGVWAEWLFLFGAIAVLYSTFFAANASHARVGADAARVFGLARQTEVIRRRWVRGLCVFFPTVSLLFYVVWPKPVTLILASGVMQGIMLPMLAGAALYFRYRRCDRRICPGRLWDVLLWLSGVGLLITGLWSVWSGLVKLIPHLLSRFA